MRDISPAAAKERLRAYADLCRESHRAAEELRLWNERSALAGCEDVREMLREKIRACIRERLILEEAIRALPERYRLLVELRYIDGFTVEEVSSRLHLDERWIYRQLAAALRIIIIDP